jgi:hypothetical protein
MEDSGRVCEKPIIWKHHPITDLIRHCFLELGHFSNKDWRLLKIEDIKDDHFYFHGKRKPTIVFFKENTRDKLNAWLKYHNGVSAYVFPDNAREYSANKFKTLVRDSLAG